MNSSLFIFKITHTIQLGEAFNGFDKNGSGIGYGYTSVVIYDICYHDVDKTSDGQIIFADSEDYKGILPEWAHIATESMMVEQGEPDSCSDCWWKDHLTVCQGMGCSDGECSSWEEDEP